MRIRRLLLLSMAMGASAGLSARAQAPSSARVETAPLTLMEPDRWHVPVALEPSRRITVVVPFDAILRGFEVQVGGAVREGQEIGQLDRAEAAARLKIAQATVKEMQAALESAKAANPDPRSRPVVAQAEARLEAAKAHAELAQLALDRCILRSPLAGRVMDLAVSPGQYLAKGETVAQLADVATLRALLPVDRSAVSLGGDVALNIEGRTVTGKVKAVLPLPAEFAPLRELAAPMAAAWVAVANPKGALEPGQRVVGPHVPASPVANVPSRAVHAAEAGAGARAEAGARAVVQVIRNEYVTDVPVRVLGEVGLERTQVSGAFRPDDVLIVSSSVPLAARTLIRFGGQAGESSEGIEAVAPRPGEAGKMAGITPPGRIAPIGPPNSASPRAPAGTNSTSRRQPPRSNRPTTKSVPSATVPF